MKISNERIVDRDDEFGHFVINCLTHLTPDQQNALAEKSKEAGYSEVLFTIDGVEIPVEDVIVQWIERYDTLLTKRALNILRDRMDSIEEVLHQAKEDIGESLTAVKEKVADSFDFSYDRWDDIFVERASN